MASSVWKLGENGVSEETIEKAIALTLDEEKNAYRNIWDELTVNPRKALRLIAGLGKEDKIYSKTVLRKHDLSEASLQRTIKSLVEKDLIDKTSGTYEINDIFFRIWLKRMNSVNS